MVGQGGGFKSKTRTSRNGWLRRSASPTLERIYKRFGDVLGIDHELLSSNRNAEELQVVRYQQSQEYAPHHDFGDDGTPEQRFLTLLLYIQLPDKGGATSFPKAADGRGLQVVPRAAAPCSSAACCLMGMRMIWPCTRACPSTRARRRVCNLGSGTRCGSKSLCYRVSDSHTGRGGGVRRAS